MLHKSSSQPRIKAMFKQKISNNDLSKLEVNFNHPDNYFNFDINPISRKNGPRYDKNNKIIKYSLVCEEEYNSIEKTFHSRQNNRSETQKHTGKSYNKRRSDFKDFKTASFFKKLKFSDDGSIGNIGSFGSNGNIGNIGNHGGNNPEFNLHNFSIISKEKLNKMFENIHNRIDKNANKTNGFLTKMPKIVQNKIMKQEKNIELFQKDVDNHIKVARYLELKTHKNKCDLLMNNIDSHRMKHEVNDIIDYTNSTVRFNETNNWIMSLRGSEKANINFGTENKPMWNSCMISPKELQIIRQPRAISKDPQNIASFTKTMSFFKIETNKTNVIDNKNPITNILSPFKTNNLKSIEDIYVEGRNLFNEEKNKLNEMDSSRIKLYGRDNDLENTKSEVILETIEKQFDLKNMNRIGNGRLKNEED